VPSLQRGKNSGAEKIGERGVEERGERRDAKERGGTPERSGSSS